jgi:hypothetical protein
MLDLGLCDVSDMDIKLSFYTYRDHLEHLALNS